MLDKIIETAEKVEKVVIGIPMGEDNNPMTEPANAPKTTEPIATTDVYITPQQDAANKRDAAL
jgi:hypothetical protein